MITVFGYSSSGNCHKVRLLLEPLGRAYAWIETDTYNGETRTPGFLARNPNGRVARSIRGWSPADSPRRAELPKLHERGHQALAVMERHLSTSAWFSGVDYGIADIALFAYTDVAPEGGFDLAPYPAIRNWLARVRETPGFVPMPSRNS